MAADIETILAENPHLKEGEKKGYWQINAEKGKITYFLRTKAHSEKVSDPEEWVRSAFLIELLEKYQYLPGFIEFETEMPKRVPNQFADIVIYDEENVSPFIVIECKKDGITDAEFEQAVKQGVGSGNVLAAQYSGAVAGSTRRFFKTGRFDTKNPIENALSDIPRKYGKPEEWKYRKGDKEWDLREVKVEELKTILGKCHQTIWRGGKRNPAEAFGEVAKIIFVKIWDEKHLTKKSEYYSFQRKSDEPAEKVKGRIASIYAEAQKHDPEVFKEEIKLTAEEVTSVVEHLQAISLARTDLDVKGEAFQKFMGSFFKGDFGQYFTPTPIVRFCISLFKDDLNNRHKVLDPACGSGGFLLNTLDFIRSKANEEFDVEDAKEAQEHFNFWHNFAEHNLFGIEINEAIARVAKMNMILHDDGHTNVIGHDSLDDIEKMWIRNHLFEKEKFDYIFTNPPFGSTVKGAEHPFILQYEIMKNGKKIRQNQKSEILFVERCFDFLKEKGRMAIVLPDSITVNSSLQYVRDFILSNAQILGIISLPDFTFASYGANVKSSILLLEKTGKSKTDYPIFMASVEHVGYTASGKFDELNNLPTVAEHFNRFLKEGDKIKIDSKHCNEIYLVQKSEIEGKRIDTKGYSPKYKEIKKSLSKIKSKTIPLADCLVDSQSGEWGYDLIEQEEDCTECFVLRNTNFDNNFNLDLSDIAVRLIPNSKIEKLSLNNNEILVEKSGGSPVQPVGRVALAIDLPNDKPVLFSNFLQKIVVNDKVVDPVYLYVYLRSLYGIGYMEYIQNQTTGIKNLLTEDFMMIQVPIPSEKEQERISSNYMSSIADTKSRISKAYNDLSSAKDKTKDSILRL